MSKHKRLTRLWRFFFTGWGLVMLVVLIIASLFSKQILWTPITSISSDMLNNDFQMTNARFAGVDKDNNPFKIYAKSGERRYNNPDIILLKKPSGSIKQKTDKGVVVNTFSADEGKYNLKEKVLDLTGHVKTKSSNGDYGETNNLTVHL